MNKIFWFWAIVAATAIMSWLAFVNYKTMKYNEYLKQNPQAVQQMREMEAMKRQAALEAHKRMAAKRGEKVDEKKSEYENMDMYKVATTKIRKGLDKIED